jgi:hypothetical protein
MAKSKKSVPVDAVQELADKATQAASIGGTSEAAESGVVPTEQAEAEKPAAGQIQVNTDYLKTTKVHISMPCYGGQLTESTFMSFIKFANMARQLGIDWTLETIVNESLISRARNTLTAKFLHAKDSTHLMFVDADIGWEAWHLLVLLNRTMDPKIKMIGGLYAMKVFPLKWVTNGFEGAEEGPDGLQEVSKTGTGFLLTAREVFGVMAQHPAVKPYKNDIGIDIVYDQYLRTYWDTAVREGRYLSEDWTACSNYRDMGGQIWVDKRVLLRHAGHANFSIEAHNDLLEKYGKMYLEAQVSAGKVQLVDQAGAEIEAK